MAELLRVSLQGGLLILLILAIRPVTKHLLPRRLNLLL